MKYLCSLILSVFVVAGVIITLPQQVKSEISKGPVIQMKNPPAPVQTLPELVRLPEQPVLVSFYYNVKNYRASFLAETVKLLLSSRGTINANDDLNIIIISDFEDNVKLIEDMLKDADVLPRQIVIEARVLELDNTMMKERGLDLAGYINRTSLTTSLLAGTQSSVSESTGNASISHSKDKSALFRTSFGSLADLINFMIAEDYATVVAEPKIVTINNRTGKVFIGERVKMSGLASNGSTIVSSNPIEEEAGLILEVTPQIGENDFITLNIKTGSGQVDSIGVNSVKSSTKEAVSTIIAKDGETIVIGGYKSREENQTRYVFPVLGKIPVIKKLFTKKDSGMRDKELVIFLVPRIVKPGEGIPQLKESGEEKE